MPPTARFSSSLTQEPDSERALARATTELLEGLDGERPDLLLAFVSHHHGPMIERLGPRLASATKAGVVLGCTGQGILGGEVEIERGPALSLWAGVLPNTRLEAFEVGVRRVGDQFAFTKVPDANERSRAALLLLADPFAFPMSDYLRVLERELPGVPAIGGMASGGSGPGQNLLFDSNGISERGAIGLVVEGEVELRPVVSQGCRPVGKPFVITACKDNLVQKLGAKQAIPTLIEVFESLEGEDRTLLQRQPFLGLAIDPTKSRFERGDFLVRGIVGAENGTGALAIGDDTIRVGQTVQFLVRDARSAGEDLAQLLRANGSGPAGSASSRGAVIFSCNGRGTRMFSAPHHDVRCVRAALGGPVPTAGFFAMGEIGPVGGRTFVHGFTASVALFQPRST